MKSRLILISLLILCISASCIQSEGDNNPFSSIENILGVQSSQPNIESEIPEITVYVTKTGEKYHRSNCGRYLKQSKIPLSLKEAKDQGFTPCSICNPPTEYSPPETFNEEISENIKITFIDVGQGDAILIQLNGYIILVDGGNNGMGTSEIIPFCKANNIECINLVVATHPDADHIGGLDEVIYSLQVSAVWDNGQSSNTTAYANYSSAIREKNITWSHPQKDEVFSLGGARVKILNTYLGYSNKNNNSLVILVSYVLIDVLLTGDIEKEAQNDIAKDYGNSFICDILKVPHHGSSNYSPNFVWIFHPIYAIFSVGRNNRYGHPAQQVINTYNDRKSIIYRTDINGDIEFITDGQHIAVHKGK